MGYDDITVYMHIWRHHPEYVTVFGWVLLQCNGIGVTAGVVAGTLVSLKRDTRLWPREVPT